MKVATHSGIFHADDVFAIATLQLAGIATDVIRTRDVDTLAQCDLRIDVGRKYAPETGDFDHHQPEGAGKRPNGVPYASFGLIWKQYGVRATGSQATANLVDERLVQYIDAEDVGYDLFAPHLAGTRPYTITSLIGSLNPSWTTRPTSADMDTRFAEAVAFARPVLEREVQVVHDQQKARRELLQSAHAATDPRLVILGHYVPWRPTLSTDTPTVLYVVYPVWPAVRDQWALEAITRQPGSFELRKPLPAAWAGKINADLAAATGVADAVFCHTMRQLVIAESKAGALRLAELALAAEAPYTA